MLSRQFPVDTLTGLQFEHWTVHLMQCLDFDAVHSTQASQDYGLDVIGKLNFGQSFGIQCKHLRDHTDRIGYHAVEEAQSGVKFYKLACGIVFTNGRFTLNAQKGAKRTGIILWDQTDLILLRRLAHAHLTIYDLLDYEQKIIPLIKILMPRQKINYDRLNHRIDGFKNLVDRS